MPSGSTETADIRIETPGVMPPPRRRTLWKLTGGLLLVLGLLALKLKGLIFLIAAKARPFFANPFEGFGITQFAWTGGSMVVSLAAYATQMGFPFAIGFILILLFHEVGHALTIRAKGLRAGAMVFIPFIGGAVTLRHQPRSAYVDAQIGLGGPIAGTIASAASLVVWHLTFEPLYLALAFGGFLLNLFNLTPVGPLDGGRIAGAITKWMWAFGAVILCVVMLRWRNPLLLPVLLLGVWQIWQSIREERRRRFYNVTLTQRATIAAFYFTLVTFLGYQTVVTYRELMVLRALR
ncbi:MAG TPA: site-2 protease family protein [Thermoanaerobaculia bacterium]|nr:site-2 protease family protein [Thermoanaerobaculia bacterium]